MVSSGSNVFSSKGSNLVTTIYSFHTGVCIPSALPVVHCFLDGSFTTPTYISFPHIFTEYGKIFINLSSNGNNDIMLLLPKVVKMM